MTEHAQEEGVVPPLTFDFLAQGRGCGVTADLVEGELSEDRKVLGRVVFPSSVAILVEHDIEHPCSWFSIPQWERTMCSNRLAGIYLESRK